MPRPVCFLRIASCAGGLALALMLPALAAPAVAEKPETPPVDTDTSPYHLALLAYKSAKYDSALTSINQAEQAAPDNARVKVLKARILIELHSYKEARAVLNDLGSKPGKDKAVNDAVLLAMGDLGLRSRSFDEAYKSYSALLEQKPGDPDLMLKIVYSRVGAGDLVRAGKYFSQLKPLDPKNPAYYFAKAAIAQSTGNSSQADEAIEDVRTVYGITVADRYLKTYYEVMEAPEATSSPAARAEPPPVKTPSTNAVPAVK